MCSTRGGCQGYTVGSSLVLSVTALGVTVTRPCAPPDVARTALNGAIGWRLSPPALCRFTLTIARLFPPFSVRGPRSSFLRGHINYFQFRPALQPPI